MGERLVDVEFPPSEPIDVLSRFAGGLSDVERPESPPLRGIRIDDRGMVVIEGLVGHVPPTTTRIPFLGHNPLFFNSTLTTQPP